MKVSKRQLRRIIKEEKQKLQEERPGKDQRMRAFVDMLSAIETYAELTDPQNTIDELQILIGDLEDELTRSEMDEEF